MLKTGLMIVGVAAIAMGLLWLGQGLGVVRWPESSFMVDQRPWAVRGSGLAIAGALVVLWARRRRT